MPRGKWSDETKDVQKVGWAIVDSESEVWFAFLTDVTLFELNQSSIKPRIYISHELRTMDS